MRCLAIIIALFLSSLVSAQNQEEQNIPFQKLEKLSLVKALQLLDREYDIAFSYNPESLGGLKVPENLEAVHSVKSFLTSSLDGSEITFELISSTYVLYPRTKPNITEERKNFTLTGKIIDEKTNEALPFAAVELKGTNRATTANTDGKFTMIKVPSDTLNLIVNYLGYRPLVINLSTVDIDKELVCKMIVQKRFLPSIQVSAQTPELIKVEKEPGKLTFNPKQISMLPNLGENDLFSALRRFPGIQGGADANSGLLIRGGQSDQNLVLFDGISVYHVDHFYGFITAFNPNVVKNVQVYKGGYEAQYGGRASGVVDVTGIDGNKSEPSLQLEANLLSANIVAELPIIQEKGSLVLAYRRSFTDIFQSPTYQNMFNNLANSSIPNTHDNNTDVFSDSDQPDFSYYDLNAKFNFQPNDRDNFTLSYYQSEDDLKYTFEGSFEGLRRSSEDDTQWGNTGGSVRWSRQWNSKFFSYINYSNSTYKSQLDADESFFFTDDSTLLSQIFYEQRSEVNDQTFRFDGQWDLNAKTSLRFGYWLSDYSLSLQAQNQDIILQDSVQNSQVHSSYISLERKWNRLKITGGLRPVYYDLSSKWYPEPRLSALYNLSQTVTLKASYGIYHQFIRRLNERSLYLSVPETWTLTSEETIPELRSDHYIAGFTVKRNGWVFDVEGYHKYERGAVEFLFPEFGNPTGNLEQFAIDGKRRIFGADLMLKRKLRNQNILLSYSFLDAQSRYDDVNGGNYFNSTGFSEHEINAVYSYEVKRWDFSLGLVVASGTPYTPVLGTFIVTLPNGEEQQFVSLGGINSANLEWYHRLDLGVNYTVPLKKGILQAGFSVYNLYYNRAIKYVDYFIIPEENSEFFSLGQRNVLSLGITPSVFLKLKL